MSFSEKSRVVVTAVDPDSPLVRVTFIWASRDRLRDRAYQQDHQRHRSAAGRQPSPRQRTSAATGSVHHRSTSDNSDYITGVNQSPVITAHVDSSARNFDSLHRDTAADDVFMTGRYFSENTIHYLLDAPTTGRLWVDCLLSTCTYCRRFRVAAAAAGRQIHHHSPDLIIRHLASPPYKPHCYHLAKKIMLNRRLRLRLL